MLWGRGLLFRENVLRRIQRGQQLSSTRGVGVPASTAAVRVDSVRGGGRGWERYESVKGDESAKGVGAAGGAHGEEEDRV